MSGDGLSKDGKKVANLAVLAAIALIVFMLENLLIPIFPIAPYIKLGISNAVLLYVLVKFNLRDCLVIFLAKVVLGSLIAGNWYAFVFNLGGGFFAILSMGLIYNLGKNKFSLVAVSVFGAVVSNIVRTGIGAIIMQTAGLFFALPIIVVISVAGGIATGALAVLSLKIKH